ncbi:MAG: hypothetical protein K8T26_16150 [Lentisphaerae bacterium]|nr:hypothetical protein [Lentisphaerota bacterium]
MTQRGFNVKSLMAGLALAALLALRAPAGDVCTPPTRFRACENASGAGLFWVETTTGRLWWADPAAMTWVFFGQPQGATPGPLGTYMPFENQSGEGVFVLNTVTGAGWWTNGKLWKVMGLPAARESVPPSGGVANQQDTPHE